jgi:P-type E1-E2 ATPase
MNELPTEIYDSKTKDFVASQWLNIQVGQIVKVKNLSAIPCDLLIIKSSMESGLAFVDTKNLDGETNLKEKLVPPAFKKITIDQLDKINGVMQCDTPNEFLDSWEGNLSIPEMDIMANFK